MYGRIALPASAEALSAFSNLRHELLRLGCDLARRLPRGTAGMSEHEVACMSRVQKTA